jgi:hypothetical protein
MTMIEIDKDIMEMMVHDFLIDIENDADDDPLILDGHPYCDEDGLWTQEAHDSKYCYTLHPDSDGNIHIVS